VAPGPWADKARRAAVAVLICAAAPAVAEIAIAQEPAGPSPKVRVSTTGSHSELRRTLPITRHTRAGKRVVMSMGPRELPRLVAGDRLELSSELQLTVNCYAPSPRCVGPPYAYSPVVQAQLVLAPGERTAAAGKVMPLGAQQREVCGQRLPHREHHCMITFDDVSHTFGPGEALPCQLDRCRVNLVVEAHSRRAGPGDRIMVGGLKPNGHIPQDRGRINAIRISPAGDPDATVFRTSRRAHKGLRPNHHGRVVYSVRLDGLKANDQIAVEGLIKTRIRYLPYNTLNAAQLVLARDRGARKPDRRVREIATLNGEIDERNGFNCTQNRQSCLSHKVGVLRMLEDAESPRGRPLPLYVNLAMVNGAKRAAPRKSDRIRVTPAGGLEVTRYPAAVAG